MLVGNFDLTNFILRLEGDDVDNELTEEEIDEGFQYLLDTGGGLPSSRLLSADDAATHRRRSRRAERA